MVTKTTRKSNLPLFRVVDLPWVTPGLGNVLKGTRYEDVLDYIMGLYVRYIRF